MEGSRLYIELAVDNECRLIAIDRSNYSALEDQNDLINHVMVEFVSNISDEIIGHKFNIILHERDYLLRRFSSRFLLKIDGTYHYYKLIIPTIYHFESSEDPKKYLVENKCFFYNGSFYFSDHDLNSLEEIASLSPITDLMKLWEYKDTQLFFWFDDYVFSICKLERCLVSLQKKIISMCYTNECVTDKDIKYKRDFILDSVFVLKYLISVKNYTEAQRILDNLSSCGNVCGDELNSSTNLGCNCGGTL